MTRAYVLLVMTLIGMLFVVADLFPGKGEFVNVFHVIASIAKQSLGGGEGAGTVAGGDYRVAALLVITSAYVPFVMMWVARSS